MLRLTAKCDVLQKRGLRAKVLTEDNNEIDTMFVDRRKPGIHNGNTLVSLFLLLHSAGFYCCNHFTAIVGKKFRAEKMLTDACRQYFPVFDKPVFSTVHFKASLFTCL